MADKLKSDQSEMDKFNWVLDFTKDYTRNGVVFHLSFKRTPNAFKVVMTDTSTKKDVAHGYMFGIKRDTSGQLHGHMSLLRVKDEYWGFGLGSIMFDARVKFFGPHMEISLDACPYGRKDLTKGNMEELRQNLFVMYSKRGFERIPNTKGGMIRQQGELEKEL